MFVKTVLNVNQFCIRTVLGLALTWTKTGLNLGRTGVNLDQNYIVVKAKVG